MMGDCGQAGLSMRIARDRYAIVVVAIARAECEQNF
jgi:hypothetical protein